MNERLSTGFTSIDHLLEGGLECGKVTYIFGRPRSGFKTTLVLNIALSLSKRRIPISIYTLAETCIQIARRFCTMMSLKTESEVESSILTDLPIYINDEVPLKISDLEETVGALVEKKKVKVIFIDYIQLVDLNISDVELTRIEEVCGIGQKLQRIACEYNIAIVVCSRLNVTVSGRSREQYDYRPESSELRDSGLKNVIQLFNSQVLITHRPQYYKIHTTINEIQMEPVEVIRYNSNLNPDSNVILTLDKSLMILK